ncbi:MAG: cobalamin B12-binding domain-containing protein, partial [Spirochaetales bacterium]|nr:cobalamin B12-binding domain-containing protein [Spirochaetales bacterium]
GRSCISVCAGPEMHCIGARMASELLATQGWDSRYLGVHTPTQDVLALCDELGADLIIVSATLDRHLEAVEALCSVLRAKESLALCKILVGGGVFDRHPELWKSLGAQGHAKSITDCGNLAEVLVPG